MNLPRLLPAALLSVALAVTACKQEPAPAPGAPPAAQPNAAKPAKKFKVAFVSNGVASFWNIAAVGVKHAGEKLGVDAQSLMPAEGISDQKRIIEDLLTRGVDGIAVSPIDPANQTELLNTAAKRAKLITHDSDAPNADRLVYIGMDNYKAGRLCGDLVREAMPNGGTVMIFIGRLEQDNAKRRRQGTIDAILGRPENPNNFDPPSAQLEGGGYKILGTLTDQFDRAKGKANAEDALAKYPDLGCMVGLFAYNPPLMLEALAQSGKLGKVRVVAFDEDDATLAGIQKGSVHGTVVQNPYMYGYKSVEVLNEILKGNTGVVPAGKFMDIPARQIRKNNVDEFWADLKTKVGGGK
ncbi:MAG: substrate-binding domain-containing protein [Verrucomicrobia bacterium]|nr:substrate-binding domain-containing protein [Verrucomicrobiota bacterium]